MAPPRGSVEDQKPGRREKRSPGRLTRRDIGHELLRSYLSVHQDDLAAVARLVDPCPRLSGDARGRWRPFEHGHGSCGYPACAEATIALQALVAPLECDAALSIAGDAVNACRPGGPGFRTYAGVRIVYNRRVWIGHDDAVREGSDIVMPLHISLRGTTEENVHAAIAEAWPAITRSIEAHGGSVLPPRSRTGVVQRPKRGLVLLLLQRRYALSAAAVGRRWDELVGTWSKSPPSEDSEERLAYEEWIEARSRPRYDASFEDLDAETVRSIILRTAALLRSV